MKDVLSFLFIDIEWIDRLGVLKTRVGLEASQNPVFKVWGPFDLKVLLVRPLNLNLSLNLECLSLGLKSKSVDRCQQSV